MKATEGGKTISVLGFRDIKIGEVDAFFKDIRDSICPATVQIVDATKVAGKAHLFFAFLNAQKSFEQRRAISGNLEMETLLYAAGTRQISRAIETMGVKPQTSSIAAVIFASSEREVVDAENKLMKIVLGIQDDSVLDVKKGKIEGLMAAFGVTELELKTMTSPGIELSEALIWLIIERVSLSTVKR